MTAPVLPPDTPIVGASRVQPQWWRWFRDVNDSVAANASAVVDAQATRVADVVLTAGNNTVAHGLGSTPTTWWAGRPRGAFVTTGDAVMYPEITPPRSSSTSIVPSGAPRNSVHTMTFTPSDGTVLIACIGFEFGSGQVSSISQTGVTWTRLEGPVNGGSSNSGDLYIGQVSNGASPIITVTYSVNVFLADVLLVVEVPELISTTPTATEKFVCPNTTFPNRHFDSSQQMTTPPVPNAGDLVFTCLVGESRTMPLLGTDWQCLAAGEAPSAAYSSAIIMAKVAQHAEHQKYAALPSAVTANWCVMQACLPTNLAALSGSSIPHGLREVSVDDTNLTVESISNVTVDLFFK